MKIRHSIISVAAILLVAITAFAGRNAGLKSIGRNAVDSTRTDSLTKAEEAIPENSIIDEVIWVVGDEPILRSDVEAMRMQGLAEGITFGSNPDCAIPEQLAVQKLFLHQAQIDSIDVPESDIVTGVNQQINRWIEAAGSQEKLEEYRKQSVNEMREQLHDEFKNHSVLRK